MGHKSFAQHIADEGLPPALLIAINLALLSVFAMGIKIEPRIGLWTCKLILPNRLFEGLAGDYLSYRMSLYAVASAIALFLTLGVLLFGLAEHLGGSKNRLPRWQGMLLGGGMGCTLLLGYPPLARSNLSVMINDLSYFVLTAVIFSTLPLMMRAFSWRYGRRRRGVETIHQMR
ncbi:hypothetical protein [Acidovorax sp. Root219]|uniref:hypothetical protein n=1 Tax=Acidovorax sp. Root219 TaxID=1736493 RepID=UPI00070DA822|nr:hypothetical protein [Acidovorax sp. Root219]